MRSGRGSGRLRWSGGPHPGTCLVARFGPLAWGRRPKPGRADPTGPEPPSCRGLPPQHTDCAPRSCSWGPARPFHKIGPIHTGPGDGWRPRRPPAGAGRAGDRAVRPRRESACRRDRPGRWAGPPRRPADTNPQLLWGLWPFPGPDGASSPRSAWRRYRHHRSPTRSCRPWDNRPRHTPRHRLRNCFSAMRRSCRWRNRRSQTPAITA